MIHRIFSDLPTFKELRFHAGLNILLAEKSPGATEKQTRNGAGKTSLIELVHFLMGSNVGKDSIFRSAALIEHRFGIEFDLGDTRISISRTGEQPSRLSVEGDYRNWPIQPRFSTQTGQLELSNSHWKLVLNTLMFGLTGPDDNDGPGKYIPSIRSLISYFVRRQSDNAFAYPVRHSEKQSLWDQQVATSFLFDLDWTIPQQWQLVRDKEKTLRELRKAAADGTFGAVIGKASDLLTMLTVSEDRTQQLRQSIKDFKVLPDYRGMEAEASEITSQLGVLADQNLIDVALTRDLEKAIGEEESPSTGDLEELYREIGVVLPNSISARFEEVKTFHESIIKNRQSYLQGELSDARVRTSQRSAETRRLETRRNEILGLLMSHGALDHFVRLQSEYARMEAEMQSVRQRYEAAVQFEEKRAEFDIERARLLRRLQQDYAEQPAKLRSAILAFERISHELYEAAGSLTINPTPNGPEFNISMPNSKSKGISNMQIFSFDMMLMQLCFRQSYGPGFLIHDSHLFDGVDERQVAKALQIGANTAQRLGFQYIVTMNSDAVPKELPGGFSIDEYVLPLRLTDATDTGGLFGIRF